MVEGLTENIPMQRAGCVEWRSDREKLLKKMCLLRPDMIRNGSTLHVMIIKPKRSSI